MNKIKFTTVVLCTIVGFWAHAQNLLTNGSFEAPLGTCFCTPTGWQSTGEVAVVAGIFPGYPPPEYGGQYAQIGVDADGTKDFLSQTFTLPSSGIYLLSWFDGDPTGYGTTPSPYSLTVFTNGNQIVVTTNLDANHGMAAWFSNSVQIALSEGIYVLRFRSETSPSGLGQLIDNVSLRPLTDNSDLITTIHLAVAICWPGRTSQLYQVQYTTSLTGTNWLALGSPVIGTGTNCVTDIVNNETRFYRVIHVP